MEPQPDDGGSVKDSLRKLAGLVGKHFYRPEESLIVELIIKEGVVSEERLLSYLKYDARLLRMCLEVLKNDRMVHSKTDRVLDSLNKVRRVKKYFIKYGQLVNVVKYKLENLRKLAGALECESVTTKTYGCPSCQKTWSDLEAGELFCTKTFRYQCPLCKVDVKGDVSGVTQTARMLVAKFNEQVGPIYDLIRSAEEFLI